MRSIALPQGPTDWILFAARSIGLLWAGFWAFFCVGSIFGEHLDFAGGIRHMVPAVVFSAALAFAWRFERLGGALLIVIGITAFLFFGMYSHHVIPGLLLMLAPPVIAGILFLAHHE